MKKRTDILLWCAIFLLPACHYHPRYRDEFYNHNMSDISLRLPLIQPYEALKSDYWTVRFHNSQSEFAADHIFVDPNRFIVGYGNNGTTVISGKTVPYMFYFLIDLKNKIEMPFNDSAKFVYELNRLGCPWSNLVPTDSIYSKYHETGLLPWLSPQK